MGPRLERQIPAAGSAAGAACGDAGDVASATDGATAAGGDAAVIPGGGLQPSGRRGPHGQRAPSTGANMSGKEGVSTSDRYGEDAQSRTLQPAPVQPAPALPTCDASLLSEPSTYDEAMRSPYRANWSHAMEGEFGGLEEAGTFADTLHQRAGTWCRLSGCTRGSQTRPIRQ